ncbi:unnamed protein product [Ambrosiozyma monospora]|uniref:Unnamed protein product n=1 Tax=Ambrosiozyma monospora TaxID=43982 RepID=A0A9W6YYW0_AMBMO|nr:unnamed protein product [Ambrosiozyma monospora]
MAPYKPLPITKRYISLDVAEQKKKIEDFLQIRLQQAPRCLDEEAVLRLKKEIAELKLRLNATVDYDELQAISNEQYKKMTAEFATSMEQLSYSTKEDLDTRVAAMMDKINTNASIQKEDQETMRGILNELMRTKADCEYLQAATAHRNEVIDDMYRTNLKLAQDSDTHNYKLADIENQVSNHGKRLSESDSNVSDIFSSMIKPYDAKIDAVDQKLSKQFAYLQNEQSETKAILNTIMKKLDALSPPPSATPTSFPKPLHTPAPASKPPTSFPQPAPASTTPPAAPEIPARSPQDSGRMSMSPPFSNGSFLNYDKPIKTMADRLRMDPGVDLNHIARLVRAHESIPDLQLTTPPSYEKGRTADKYINDNTQIKLWSVGDGQFKKGTRIGNGSRAKNGFSCEL